MAGRGWGWAGGASCLAQSLLGPWLGMDLQCWYLPLLHDSRSQADPGGVSCDDTNTSVPLAAMFLILNGEPSILICQFLVGKDPITSGGCTFGRWKAT